MNKEFFDRRYLRIFITLFALYLAITYWPSVAKFIGNVGHATIPLITGAVLAYIINILLNQWEHLYEKLFPTPSARKLKRGICITLSYISIIVILSAVLWLVIPEVIACIKLLLAHHSRIIEKTITYLSNHSFKYLDPSKINWSAFFKQASIGVGGTFKIVRHTATKIISFGTTTIIAIFFSVYLLIFKEMLRQQFYKLMDFWLPRAKTQIMYVIRVFDNSFSSYISSQCKDAAILGICCFIGMTILRLPYAYMMGAVTTVTALIPIIGAILGASVGVIIIFAISPVKALIFLIFIIILQQLDNRITYPIVVGKAIDLPSVWVFVAVMVGGGVSGIIGMMFTVPLFAALYRIIRDQSQQRTTKVKQS